MSRSTYSVPSPNAAAASRRACSMPAASARSSRMVFIPMPPPPADGLRRIGKPTLRADAAMALLDWSAGVSPGTTGTPAFCAIARAAIFDPSRSITAAGGPMNVMPASAHAAANAAFSDRKP